MAIRHTRLTGEAPPLREALDELLRAEGLSPRWWSNGAGDTYGRHRHEYHKVLYCQSGSIVFHTTEGDFGLSPGDRLDITPGTDHSATVGANGVVCVEAAK